MNKTATNYHHQQVIFVSAGFTETNPLPAELNSLFTQGNLNEENVYYVGDFTKAVSKEMIQQALTWASYTSDAKKVVVVKGAEKLTLSAANSLLKTLENPWQNVFFWLCTTALHLTLPTIRSRCIIVKKQNKTQKCVASEIVQTAKQFLLLFKTVRVFRFVQNWVRDYEPKQLHELLQLLVSYWQKSSQVKPSTMDQHYLKTTLECLEWIKKAPYQTKYWLEWWIWELHSDFM